MGASYTTRQALTTGPCHHAPSCFPQRAEVCIRTNPCACPFPAADVESPRNLRAGPAVPWWALKPLRVAQRQAGD